MEFPAIGIETSSRLSRDEEIQLRHALVQIAADQKGQEQWVKVASPVGVSAGESRHVHIAKVVPGGRLGWGMAVAHQFSAPAMPSTPRVRSARRTRVAAIPAIPEPRTVTLCSACSDAEVCDAKRVFAGPTIFKNSNG